MLLCKIRIVPIELLCEVCHILNLKCILICQYATRVFLKLYCDIQTNPLINQRKQRRAEKSREKQRKAEKSKNELGLKLI